MKFSFPSASPSSLAPLVAPVLLWGSQLAIEWNDSLAQDRVQRSTADVRDRPPDELDRPRNKERWTHRGYEVRTNQFIVVANTRAEDARWAAEQMELAWTDFGKLADAWMKGHHHPDFGIGAVQVFIDGNAPKDRDLPLTTLNVVGIQTQITLHLTPGKPALEDQVYRLRKAAGQAFLHTAELDRQLPPWACDGLASYVAAARLDREELKNSLQRDQSPSAPKLAGQQWRFKRAQQDQLDIPPFDQTAAAQEIEFLLTANDAAHVPAFVAAVQDSIAAVSKRRSQENLVTARRGEEQPADLGPVDQLAAKLARSFDAWQENPLAGQPFLELDEKAPPEVQQAQRELAVALKLARRFSNSSEPAAVRTRITAFDKDKGMTVLSPKAEFRPAPLSEVFQRLSPPERPLWGTLDADGRLVLSTDRAAVKDLLGIEHSSYRWETLGGKSVLTTTVDNQWKISGLLEENKDDPSRPIARFTAARLERR